MMSIPFPANATTALSRISVSSGDFIRNGVTWNPAGMNYTKVKTISWNQYDSYGNFVGTLSDDSHSTLLVNSFNATNVANAFSSISYDGYNSVRVMINSEGIGTADSTTYYGIAGPYMNGVNHKYGLYIPYMNNVISMLQEANSHGLYVIVCLNYIPYNNYYQSGLSKPSDGNNGFYIDDINLLYMYEPFISAKENYIKNFIQYIIDEDPALLSTILSYDFMNEINVTTVAPPFSRTESIATADGLIYNMSDDAQRQQCVDSNIVNWANRCMSALTSKDSSGMGNLSLFTFRAIGLPNGGNGVHSLTSDKRYPARPTTLSIYSNIKFIDMHLYPNGSGYTIDSDLSSSEYNYINKARTPLILGEFGGVTTVYSTIESAAYAMKDLKNYCKNSLGFKGWLFWTWDSNQVEWYNAVQNSGAINGQLAPSVWGW